MQSSSPYTLQPIKSRKPWLLSTTLIGLASVGGALGIDLWMNGGISSLIPSGTSTTSSATISGPQTVAGDAVNYQYGTIQVSVTSDNGTITAVEMLQSDATAGREAAFPYLQQYAVAANGTNFGNLSGATFTTDAFKQALNSAIAKLG